MSILTLPEKQLAQEIIEAGYVSAARSFSGVAQQQVMIETSGITISKFTEKYFSIKEKGNLTLITTKIIGDIQGESFLLLTESERQAMFNTCLPPGGSPEERHTMQEAILKELDNIISAAVITEASNVLQVNIYGDVPKLVEGTAEEIQLTVLSNFTDSVDSNIFLFANTRFSFEQNTALQPRFFWKFHQNFVDRIKEQVNTLHQYRRLPNV
ncbi:chemotaxis protein CheC [Tunicatimonas pelagia]|uniref:chemotaxis protein CheC n=1 Tax=Tunicatimonas pelagia TaxID=931531 RepID=UPI0026659E2C|nr:hypothetical protein [Tunicatimonas pelagia]WKN41384.1 hypothetical protein P0M28_20320 [Tunicatimonas pelagia]